ncbi:hypothetical protein CEV33_3479 [Brucella grignonensis]|uniref:Uncharacterized protein n=1 Tax=Brucella grignonensis TaxID=94627 RepID=A0A256EYV4_9HYPH|nr:hypothetical protein [Brucella grignonensis]OYR07799.1 hypothetical protein CEV33_3479 [Brucella grignonensis]
MEPRTFGIVGFAVGAGIMLLTVGGFWERPVTTIIDLACGDNETEPDDDKGSVLAAETVAAS